jgi:hypothetical protein
VEHQWLISVILATAEAEIRRTGFEASRGKKFMRLHLKQELGVVSWV